MTTRCHGLAPLSITGAKVRRFAHLSTGSADRFPEIPRDGESIARGGQEIASMEYDATSAGRGSWQLRDVRDMQNRS